MMTLMQRIRHYYNVPAKRGTRVEFGGQPGVITGTTRGGEMYLRIRLDDGTSHVVHPMWAMDYLDGKGQR